MTRDELEHVIRAACDVAGDDSLFIFGSQAILASFPQAPDVLRQSVEADVAPRARPDRWEAIDGSIGELSPFHQQFGVYAHGIEVGTIKLPKGWDKRLVPVCTEATLGRTGLCLEPHDLAASKLVAFREKDTDFVRVLLTEHMIDPKVLVSRIQMLDLSEEHIQRMTDWVLFTAFPPGT